MANLILKADDPSNPGVWHKSESISRNIIPITLATIKIKKQTIPTVITDLQCLINRNDLAKASTPVLEFMQKYAYEQGTIDPYILEGNPYLLYKKDMVNASPEIIKFVSTYGYMVLMPITIADIPNRIKNGIIDLTKVQCLINRNDLLKASQPVLKFMKDYAYIQGMNDSFIVDGNPYLLYKEDMVNASSEVSKFVSTYGYMVQMSTLKMKEGIKDTSNDTDLKSINPNTINPPISFTTSKKEIPWLPVGLAVGALVVIVVIVKM